MPDADEILAQLQLAQDTANRKNQERYKKTLGLWDEMIRMFKGGYGRQAIKDVRRGGRQEKGQNVASTAARGLHNTTVLDSLNTRTNERTQREISRVREDLTAQIVRLMQGKAGVMERKQERGPDMGQWAPYLAQLGQGEGGGTDWWGLAGTLGGAAIGGMFGAPGVGAAAGGAAGGAIGGGGGDSYAPPKFGDPTYNPLMLP